jgi:hypothetical protein
MELKKLTPILLVDTIEPSLPFWVEKLGFTKTTEVPDGERAGFVILEQGGLEVMYQTLHSVQADVPALASTPGRGTVLFIEVASIDEVQRALAGYEVVVPRRRTFYGADEIFVREPGGHIIGFAQFGS